jgi:uncharacterized protein
LPSAKSPRRYPPQVAHTPEVVDPRWILKAIGAVLALGLLCAYITLCAFFAWGQWQFVLHPSRAVPRTPAALGLAFEAVRFGDDVAGHPQLAGWWIPGDAPSDPAVILLHGASGSRSDALPLAKALHDARLGVLLFDPRGYGDSAGGHPSQTFMQEDAEQALSFLARTRALPEDRILVFGRDLGASVAVHLAASHPSLPGVILLEADGDTATRVEADQRSRIVPIGLLFHERFPLADPLRTLRTPKLLISYTRGGAPEIATRASAPKLTVELAPDAPPEAISAAVRRFLDTYLPSIAR